MINTHIKKRYWLETAAVCLCAVCFWLVEGTVAPAPTYSDCHGEVVVLQ